MQPNLQQDARFNYSAKPEVMQKYLTLSDRASGPQSTGVRDATVLIWPESAFPFFLTREADAMAQIAALLPKGTVLITGSVRAPDQPPGTRITRAYNSIYVIDHDGSVLSVYDKLHLVPFGEYLPFQNWMEMLGLQQLTKVQGGFIPGTLRRAMEIPGAPRVLPLICYEVIFPDTVAAHDDRPGWIVNLTNDGWFGISTGPYQHLQQAQLRAIEQGLPVVRASALKACSIQRCHRPFRRPFTHAQATFPPQSSSPWRLFSSSAGACRSAAHDIRNLTSEDSRSVFDIR
jgi:apolipoprotein N-acyltransferase